MSQTELGEKLGVSQPTLRCEHELQAAAQTVWAKAAEYSRGASGFWTQTSHECSRRSGKVDGRGRASGGVSIARRLRGETLGSGLPTPPAEVGSWSRNARLCVDALPVFGCKPHHERVIFVEER